MVACSRTRQGPADSEVRMRIGELEAFTWGDVDEPGAVARVRNRGEDRPHSLGPGAFRALPGRAAFRACRPGFLSGLFFQGFGRNRLRTALTRACIAAGVPQFSPHDLRHRRVSLLHLAGMRGSVSSSATMMS